MIFSPGNIKHGQKAPNFIERKENTMALGNQIARTNAKPSPVTEFEANGEMVKLSPAMVRRYLVSGGGNVTDEEVTMFLTLCKYQHLNPFIRDAYLIKYGDIQPATMVVGKDVFVKRAKRQPDFDGLQAGIIIREKESGEVIEREGTFYDKQTEVLVGGWAKCFIKNYTVPFYCSVALDEYIGRKKNGEVNGQWAGKPATMIRKVALAQVLRDAFPEQNAGGMYVQEEINEAQNVVLDDEAVVVAEEPTEQPVEAAKTPVPDASQGSAGKSAGDILFS